MRPTWLLLSVPVILAAQSPSGPALAEAVQAASMDVDNLLKAFQGNLALERAQSALPATKPTYKAGDAATLLDSHRTFRAFVAGNLLAARAAQAAGQWEKAQAHADNALAVARENQAGYAAGSQITVEAAMKAMADAETFKKEKLAQIQELISAAKNVKNDPLELLRLKQSISTQEETIAKGREAVATIRSIRQDLDKDIQMAQGRSQELAQALKAEQAGIEAFNKAKKKAGRGAWVQAALVDPKNGSLYPTPETQSARLHRLTVLDPANTAVQDRLKGLREGKPAFAPAKPAKAAKAPARKKK